MTGNSKYKIKGIIGTVIFHLLLILALFFFALSTPLPLPGEEGVEVNLGSSDNGMGIVQEDEPAESMPPQTVQEEIIKEEVQEVIPEEVTKEPIIEEIQEEEILTQDTEEAPYIDNPEEKDDLEEVPDEKIIEQPKEEPKVQEKQQEELAEKKPEVVEKEPEPVVNPNALYKGKSKNTGNGSNEGITGEPGDQGKPHGTKDAENYDGLGGEGNGISYSLAGRSSKHLPKPKYTSQEQGKIVITIWVNKAGIVTKVVEGAKGTNISDLGLRRLAKEAALKARFSTDNDPNTPEIQKGTITYNFIRLN